MIDPRAIVDVDASLAPGVRVGPYAVIGPGVRIGEGSWIGPHALIEGPTVIGRENRIYGFAAIGGEPQDKKYHGEASALEIGDRNVIREYCTINRGTEEGGGVTRIGNDNWIMAYVHIAHDCLVGDGTVFANNASLAGHVVVEEKVILGGFTLVHQFCTLGAYSFSAMGSAIAKDVPPYMMVRGAVARPHGLNSEGLRRNGFPPEVVRQLKQAYRLIYRSGLSLTAALEEITALEPLLPQTARLVEFVRASRRGIVR